MLTVDLQISSTIAHLGDQLELLTKHWPQFSDTELQQYPGPGRWSRKEILGHLVDSAANNHARFVQAQIGAPQTPYGAALRPGSLGAAGRVSASAGP